MRNLVVQPKEASNRQNGASLQFVNNILCIVGTIYFENVDQLYIQGLTFLRSSAASTITIDLSKLEGSNSSGLALLTAWVREAKKVHKKVTIAKMPKELWDVAEVCGLGAVLPIQH